MEVKMYNNQMLRLEKSYTLEKYEKTLTTKEYYTKFVNFDETSESCKICDMYGKNWSCPPFENDVTNSWNKYDHLHLILLQLHYDSFITDNIHSKEDIDTILHLTLFNEKRKLLQSLDKKIREDENLNDTMILSTGYCNICSSCTKKEGMPCRYPKNKLYSIESIGALVTKTTEELFNTKIKWIDMDNGIIPEYLTLLMGVLY